MERYIDLLKLAQGKLKFAMRPADTGHAQYVGRVPSHVRSQSDLQTEAIVATGILSGQSTKAIAGIAGTSRRTVQRIAADPETQFLITEAVRPHQAQLEKLAGKAIGAAANGLGAYFGDSGVHRGLTRETTVCAGNRGP